MRKASIIIIFSISLLTGSCVTKFIPEIDEKTELVVVDGIITDRPGINTIKLYKSMPLGKKVDAVPIGGCTVEIMDDLNNSYDLSETATGTYVTDSAEFRGIVGRKYTLKIYTNSISMNNYSYESLPMEMKPVPPIGNIYFEKTLIKEEDKYNKAREGCRIYLDTYDPDNLCSYYRWDYTETWEIHLPYLVKNKICWITNNSSTIEIKNTAPLSENQISGYPLMSISDQTDRLKVKYCILVNQYSLNDDEYMYWEKTKNITESVGGLFDITPASVPSNIYCIEDPKEKVLGYFSVSAMTSKRLFITDYFSGIIDLYRNCETEKIYGPEDYPITGLNFSLWVIIDGTKYIPPYRIITDNHDCADCTLRGTNKEPAFWNDPEAKIQYLHAETTPEIILDNSNETFQ